MKPLASLTAAFKTAALAVPWWAISLLSNIAIIATEYLNRTSPTLPAAWSRSWPLILMAQAGLWFSYRHAPSLLGAWIVFTIGNSAVRLLMASTVLGEPFRPQWALLGAGLMVAASFCIKRATMS